MLQLFWSIQSIFTDLQTNEGPVELENILCPTYHISNNPQTKW